MSKARELAFARVIGPNTDLDANCSDQKARELSTVADLIRHAKRGH